MRDCFLPTNIALGLSYNSHFKQAINVVLEKLKEAGIVSLYPGPASGPVPGPWSLVLSRSCPTPNLPPDVLIDCGKAGVLTEC